MRIDLLVTNANIHTLDEQHPRAHTLAIHQGKILAVDPEQPLSATRTVDAEGATIVPGFNDAHNHMAWFGLALDEVALADVADLEELYARVEERAAQLPQDAWVTGSGYDHNRLAGHPNRQRLDAAAGGRAVWLKHRSGHVSFLNSEALARVGLLHGNVDVPEGGTVARNDRGLTGVLEEQAQNLVVDKVTPYSTEALRAAVTRASRVFAAEGLTHVTEAGIGRGWLGKSPLELLAYQEARERDELAVRVQLMPSAASLHGVTGHAEDSMRFGLDLGMRTGFGDDWIRLGPMKIWLDGSLVARTAAVHEPFCDHGHTNGYLQDDPKVMRDNLVAAHVAGWRVAAHAIGDAAIDLALDAITEAQQRHPRADIRHRLEHAGIARPDQVTRMAKLQVTPVPQHRFLYETGDTLMAAVGADRVPLLYRHASFLAAGMRVPGSSDRPVVDGAPLAGIQSMVERLTDTGAIVGVDERVDVHTALAAYTRDGAWIAGEERCRGQLSAGFLADFAVLGDDITAIDSSKIAATQVVATYVAGAARHGEEALRTR